MILIVVAFACMVGDIASLERKHAAHGFGQSLFAIQNHLRVQQEQPDFLLIGSGKHMEILLKRCQRVQTRYRMFWIW